jgi:60 kDa SS-A/Ro ribonucleoprotein
MSKLNPKAKSTTAAKFAARELGKSENGNLQFMKSSAQDLFELVVSSLYGQDKFYESGADTIKRVKEAVRQVLIDHGTKGAEYIGRLVIFARSKMNMRTMPIATTVLFAEALRETGVEYAGLRKTVAGVISRADELTDLYAFALTTFGEKNKIPGQIKKGVADAFNKFDGYQLAKYNRDDQRVTLKRLLRVVHPVPKDEAQSNLFKQLMTETLEPPHTWEVLKTQNGMLPEGERKSEKELWTELVTHEGTGEMGYMALLRNLRNICQAKVDSSTLKLVTSKISDPSKVAKSKQLPWAFINAYDVAKAENLPTSVLTAVAQAAEHSLSNMPKMGDGVWLIVDCSSSMNNFPSNHPFNSGHRAGRAVVHNSPIKIAAIFAAALYKAAAMSGADNVKLSMFSDRAEFISLNPLDSIMTMYEKIMSRVYGGGTNIDAAFRMKSSLGFEPDTVVVLSDMEVNPINDGSTSSWYYNGLKVPADVNKLFKANTMKVAVNLGASKTTPLDPRDGWLQLAGWSEAIFRYVDFKRRSKSVAQQLFNGEL